MKSNWTDATLADFNVTSHLNQPLTNVIPPEWTPSDDDPVFHELVTPLLNEDLAGLGRPPKRGFDGLNETHEPIFYYLDYLRMYPGSGLGGPKDLLGSLIDHVTYQKLFFKSEPPKCFRAQAMQRITWRMGKQKWRADHQQCLVIRNTQKPPGKYRVHYVCGRAYWPYSEMDSDGQTPSPSEDEFMDDQTPPPPEDQNMEDIAKDVGMLCSQVAAAVKATRRIIDHEGFVWGMSGFHFYIVRGYFPASYVEAVHIRSAPLPPDYAVEVHRSVFYDMRTIEGRRESLRIILGLVRYMEWKEQFVGN